MTSEKEKLEQELKFLQESLEAEVITKEEYEKGKERIEKKLQEIEEKERGESKEIQDIEKTEELKEPKMEISSETKETVEEKKELTEEAEVKEEKVPSEEIKEEEKIEEEKPKEAIKTEEKAEAQEIMKRKTKVTIGIITIIGIIILAYILFNIKSEDNIRSEEVEITKIPEIVSEFKEEPRISLIIINDKNCLSCDSERMVQILKQLFPQIVPIYIDYNTTQGKELINRFDIDALPAYLLDKNVTKSSRFNEFKIALINKNSTYIIKPTAAGANLYFKRKEIPKRLELFIESESNLTPIVMSRIQEILNLFGNKIEFIKHDVDRKEKHMLAKELGITSYPSFLINNKLKFSGVQSAEKIKERFCELNKLKECEKKLSLN